MRLINVRTRRTEEFYGKAIPKYAILSHTWGPREITLQTMQTFGASYKRWPLKLSGLCMQAADDGIDYVWVDTCCINKMDLVELSEAINSMFTWYQKAAVCYAYLADVELESEELEPENLEPEMLEEPEEHATRNWKAFCRSRWFTRGWTLQELLAPDQVKFYDSKWVFIGTKRTLLTKLQVVTGIPRSFILGATPVSKASVAQRFSWAANRETTRVEDMAYCLLGLFNVNMPMIYGEGEKAFVRLQREIMNVHRDQSILAWGYGPDDEGRLRTNLQQSQTEVLATRPEQFRHCGRLATSQTFPSQNTFEWLTGTLKLHLTLFTDPTDGVEYGLLNCGHEKGPEETLCHIVGLPLTKLPTEGSECYARKLGTSPKVICYDPVNVTMPQPRVVQLMGLAPQNPNNMQSWIYLEEPAIPFQKYSFSLVEVSPRAAWKKDRDMIDTSVTSEPGVVVTEMDADAAGTADVDKLPDTSSSSSSNRETVFYLRYRYAQYGSSTQSEDDFVVRVEPNRPPRLPQAKISVTRLSQTQELQDFVRVASSGIHVDESNNTYVGQTEDEKLAVVVSLSLRIMAGQSVFVLELSASERSGNRPGRDNAIPEMLWRLTGLGPALQLPHYRAEAESVLVFIFAAGLSTLLCPWLLWKLWQGWKRFAGAETFSVGEESSLLTILFLMPTRWFLWVLWLGGLVFGTLFLPFSTFCIWKVTYDEAVALLWQL